MPEYRLSKQIGEIRFEMFADIFLDDDGNIETHEFYNDVYWCENPCEIIYANIYCDESKQEEWNLFSNSIAALFENKDFLKKIKKLENVNDSFYFSEEEIDVVLTEED
ncbi:MAG: hypothetical protein Q4P18_04990 [Methanobrevibacter sp.]|uniref:hypothetical protein n=1 Tax=Methanobrevibacter sp. TaxID=66852 RepID=UPI0026E02032|nr:hypothetical protein [Methanobrevibacter sp.]MDO5848868.1 hypothetical protein [Methanobrevibacter sp.]